MEKSVLFTVIEPREAGKNPRLYYVEGNHFSTDKSEAHIVETREEMMSIQDRFDFDLQLEKVEV